MAAAALRGWSLLLSTLTAHQVRHINYDSDGEGGSSDGLERRLTALSKALASSDVGVRQAAGEGAALLYNQSGLATEQDSPSESGCVDFLTRVLHRCRIFQFSMAFRHGSIGIGKVIVPGCECTTMWALCSIATGEREVIGWGFALIHTLADLIRQCT